MYPKKNLRMEKKNVIINYYYYNYYCYKHPRNIDIEFHLELLSGTLDMLPDTSDFFLLFLMYEIKGQ